MGLSQCIGTSHHGSAWHCVQTFQPLQLLQVATAIVPPEWVSGDGGYRPPIFTSFQGSTTTPPTLPGPQRWHAASKRGTVSNNCKPFRGPLKGLKASGRRNIKRPVYESGYYVALKAGTTHLRCTTPSETNFEMQQQLLVMLVHSHMW